MGGKKTRAQADDGLSDQHKLYCLEYIKDLNATKAALRAGYAEGSARQQASALMSKPNIQRYIQELFDQRSKRVEVNADTILRELLAMATVDVTEAYDDAGWLKQIKDIPAHVRKSIAGLETQEIFQGEGDDRSIIGMARKVKFYDKTKALELLGKHLKIWTDKVEHSGTISLEQLIGAANAPKKEDQDG